MVDNLLGLLRVRIKRGVNLAVRDARSSDPYVVLRMGMQFQSLELIIQELEDFKTNLICNPSPKRINNEDLIKKLKSRVIKRNVNPEWNEDLTLSVEDPTIPVRLEVYDKDRFSADDPMGNAEFDIQPFVEALKMKSGLIPNGTILNKTTPNRRNCLAEESLICLSDGEIVQDMVLRLKEVESGEVELRLGWVNIPGSKGL